MQFELCCSNIHSVQLAEIYSLEAIELCSCIEVGGLSPGPGLLETARELFSGQIAVLIRPRPGNFCYDILEQALILKEIKRVIEMGADAIVVGALDTTFSPDPKFLKKVIDASYGTKLVFHRAIDLTTEPEKTLELLMDLQFDGILSSGTKSSAKEGAEILKEWKRLCGNALEITAAGGILPENTEEILHKSKADRVHASLRKTFNNTVEKMNLGSADEVDEALLKKMIALVSE